MPTPIVANYSMVQFESLLPRLGQRGHVVPQAAQYVRRLHAVWSGFEVTCTRCGATARTVLQPPVPRSPVLTRKTPAKGRGAGRSGPGSRRALVDYRLLVQCTGPSGQEGQPWPGRPWP